MEFFHVKYTDEKIQPLVSHDTACRSITLDIQPRTPYREGNWLNVLALQSNDRSKVIISTNPGSPRSSSGFLGYVIEQRYLPDALSNGILSLVSVSNDYNMLYAGYLARGENDKLRGYVRALLLEEAPGKVGQWAIQAPRAMRERFEALSTLWAFEEHLGLHMQTEPVLTGNETMKLTTAALARVP